MHHIFQKYLKSTHSDEILHLIFLELSNNLEELIIDPYANYFCKKFFTFLNSKDRIDFLKNIEKALIELSSDSIGTYPIQSIIEHLNTNNEKNIFFSNEINGIYTMYNEIKINMEKEKQTELDNEVNVTRYFESIEVDLTPTLNSSNLVTSNGVYSKIHSLGLQFTPNNSLLSLKSGNTVFLDLNGHDIKKNNNGTTMWNRGTAQCGQVYFV